MDFYPNDYVLGIWILDAPGANFMITIIRRESGVWEGESRLRIYVDDKNHDSDDHKTFWSMTAPQGTPEEELEVSAMKSIDMIRPRLEQDFGPAEPRVLLIKGSPEKCMERMREHPSFHMKEVSKEEAIEMGLDLDEKRKAQ